MTCSTTWEVIGAPWCKMRLYVCLPLPGHEHIVGAPCAHRHNTLLVHHDALNATLYQIFIVNIRQNDADILPQNIGKDHV